MGLLRSGEPGCTVVSLHGLVATCFGAGTMQGHSETLPGYSENTEQKNTKKSV